MTRCFHVALASAVLCLAPSFAAIAQMPMPSQPTGQMPATQMPMQQAKPVTEVSQALAAYNQTKQIIIGSAELMPADKFSYKATPEIRTFAQMFTHVAQTQMSICPVIAGTPPATRPVESTATSKEEVLAVIKKSFDVCDAAYNSVTDANAMEVGGTGYMRGSKLGNMWKNVAHNNEMYGQMVIYLRLNGLVPPSTAMRGRM